MRTFFLVLLACVQSGASRAWDYHGHRMVNQLALRAWGANAPAYVRTAEAQERIAFLSGEPDRWRNTPDLPLKHASNPDHFFDVDALVPYKMDPAQLPHFRYDFVSALALARSANPRNFPSIDPARDPDHTKALPGFLPWTMAEYYAKLKSAFSYLKAYEQGGTPDEIANAQANIVAIMGTMGHFVGDAAQPLHATLHYNGWVGDNPNKYTTAKTFHSWIDGGYITRLGLALKDLEPFIRPAKSIRSDSMKHPDAFPECVAFIVEQFPLVEKLYQLERDKKLANKEEGEGKALMLQQLSRGALFLADLWFTAALEAGPDEYLINFLARRKKN